MRRRLIRLLQYSTFGGTSSLSPKRIFSSMRRRLIRLLRYSTFGGTSSLSPKRIFSSMRWQLVDYYGTRPSEGHVPYLPRGSSRPWDNNWPTTSVLELQRNKFPISKKKQFIHEVTIHRLLQYSTQLRQDLHFPRGLSHPWSDNSSIAMTLDFEKIQDF